MLANSLAYAVEVMGEWGDDMAFLQLQYYAQTGQTLADGGDFSAIPDEALDGSVFDAAVAEYSALATRFLDVMVDRVADEFRSDTRPYRRLTSRWAADAVNPEVDDLSPYLCDGLANLRAALHAAEDALNAVAFGRFWRALATRLDTYMYDDVICQNRFGRLGGAQMATDVDALVSLFRPFTRAPAAFFKQAKDATTLLTLPNNEARALRAGLDPDAASSSSLEAHGIVNLSPRMALFNLDDRVDFK